MAKFALSGILNEQSSDMRVPTMRIEHIPYDQLAPSALNKYSMPEVESMAQNIRDNGLMQPLLVSRQGERYEIVSGHRRHAGIGLIRQDDSTQYEQVPCIVEKPVDEMMQEYRLIMANIDNRVKTDADKVYEMERIRALTEALKARGVKLGKRQREAVAEAIGASPAQVQKYERISRDMIPPLREEFDAGKLTISQAYDAARLPQEQQHEAYDGYKATGELAINAPVGGARTAGGAVRDMSAAIAEHIADKPAKEDAPKAEQLYVSAEWFARFKAGASICIVDRQTGKSKQVHISEVEA